MTPVYRFFEYHCTQCGKIGYTARIPEGVNEAKCGPVECGCGSRTFRPQLAKKQSVA